MSVYDCSTHVMANHPDDVSLWRDLFCFCSAKGLTAAFTYGMFDFVLFFSAIQAFSRIVRLESYRPKKIFNLDCKYYLDSWLVLWLCTNVIRQKASAFQILDAFFCCFMNLNCALSLTVFSASVIIGQVCRLQACMFNVHSFDPMEFL